MNSPLEETTQSYILLLAIPLHFIYIMNQLFEMPYNSLVLRFNLTALMQLLLYYGDTDLKGTLSDEHAMVSAKCRVCSTIL